MELLKECFEIRREMTNIDESIEEIKAVLYTPKGQDLSGMPKGGGNIDDFVDKLITKKNKLEARKTNLTYELGEKWIEVDRACDKAHLNTVQRQLLSYRYYYGLAWKKCKEEMCNFTGKEWNDNKIYRVHRTIICKLDKINKKTA